jgi:CHASE2 domain-containing protein
MWAVLHGPFPRKDALIIGLNLLFLWLVNPLEVASNADRASVALFYRIVAPSYPEPYDDPQGATPFDDKTQIAVIVLNDESLASMVVDTIAGTVDIVPPEDKLKGSSATWPPSMIVHNAIVKKIFESATPKALFIDFGFFDERDPIATDEFARTLARHAVSSEAFKPCLEERPRLPKTTCTGWDRKAPIFLPRADASAPAHLKVLAPLRDAVTDLVSTRYIGEEFETYNQYELYDCALETRPEEPLEVAPSAALAMFSAGGGVPAFRAADCDEKKTPERLSIYWSDWGDAENGRGSFSCRTLPNNWFKRIWRTITVWITFGNVVESQFQDCPPHLSVSAQEFLADDTGLMAAILDGRYVFFGGNFVMADDLIRPPTHTPIPGVYVHAMVLDNLLSGLGKYLQSGWSQWPSWLLMFLAILISTVVAAYNLKLIDGGKLFFCSRLNKFVFVVMSIAIGIVACVGIITALTVVGFFSFNMPPINFVGIFLVIALHLVMHGVGMLIKE